MPRFHETTRRTICRVAFLAVCVAPTVAVLAWAASSNAPSRVAEAERELAASLELAVAIDDVAYPRPGATVYSGLTLSDGETGRVVASAERLQCVETSEGASLLAGHVEADARSLDQLWRVVDRALRIGRATDHRPLRMSIERLTLHGAAVADSVTLTRVGGQLACDDQSSRAGLRFSLPESEASEPVQLVLRRAASAGQPETRLELRTGGAPLPLAAMHGLFPSLKHLGDRADFTGQLWATQTGPDRDLWTGELAGRLRHVDLDTLVTRQFPHKLSGEADIRIERLALAAGRVERFVGSLEAGPGVIGQSLLDAAADSLGMTAAKRGDDRATDEAAARRADLLKYDRLAVAFDIDGQHATLRGECPTGATANPPSAAGPDESASTAAALCVLRDRFGPLLFESDRQPHPSLALVRLLVPSSDLHVPATRQSDWLLHRFPIPAAAASETSAGPTATLRDATAGDAP